MTFQYTYEKLDKIEIDQDETCNFYGVVIDANFPYKNDRGKWICQLKVVDDTMNISRDKENFAIVTIMGRKLEDLPICQRVGDLIRVHRAQFELKDDQAYFRLNLCHSSAWALFSADQTVAPECSEQNEDWDYTPYAFNGHSFTFEHSDRKILDKLKIWNKSYFQNNEVLIDVMFTPLNKAHEEDGDFNIIGKITQVVHRDEWNSDIRIRDRSGDTWFSTIIRKQFPRIKEGEIVKIRSCKVDDDSTRVKSFSISSITNFMTIVPFAKIMKQLNKIPLDSTDADEFLLDQETIQDPVLASTVSPEYQDMECTSLEEIFSAPSKDNQTSRVRFYVVHATKGSEAIYKEGKKSPHIQQQFLVKDTSVATNDKAYKVFLCGGAEQFYNGLKANNKKAPKQIDEHLEDLSRFNVHLDAVLERRNGYYFITETELKQF